MRRTSSLFLGTVVVVTLMAAAQIHANNTAVADVHGLRHVDVDLGAEDAAALPFLPGFMDSDDAIGSVHTVCALGFGLTGADNAFIDWLIEDTELDPTVANLFELAGNDLTPALGDLPCVQWVSGAIGDQAILAIHDPDADGPEPATTLLWDGILQQGADQPLVKEWNSIDVTRLVLASGTVGPTIENSGTSEVSNLNAAAGSAGHCVRSRDAFAADVNCSDRPDLAGQTITVAGPVSKGKLGTAKQSFIDYALGSHTTHFNGAIDGAEQVYTFGGCGSVRLEDSVTGGTHLLTAANRSATVLTSNYGVAFTVFSTSDGADLAPDGSNASCKLGSRTKVTITTQQYLVLTSFEDTAPPENLTIRWERSR